MVDWLKQNCSPNAVLWDVGSNVGAYTMLAAKLSTKMRVVAFEPFVPTFAQLWENTVLNQVTDQVIPLCVGLSDETGLTTISVNDPRPGSASHAFGGNSGKLTQPVWGIRGDDIPRLVQAPPPTMLKIDTDGHEVSVLRGMHSILRDPTLTTVLVEVDSAATEKESEALVTAAGFTRCENPLAKPTGTVFNALFRRL